MNPEAQAKLDEILAQEPAAITEEDRAFLHARRSYLTEEQRNSYGVTDAPTAPQVPPEESEDAPKKSKK